MESEVAGVLFLAYLGKPGNQTVSKVEPAIVWHLTKDKAISNTPNDQRVWKASRPKAIRENNPTSFLYIVKLLRGQWCGLMAPLTTRHAMHCAGVAQTTQRWTLSMLERPVKTSIAITWYHPLGFHFLESGKVPPLEGRVSHCRGPEHSSFLSFHSVSAWCNRFTYFKGEQGQ